MIRVSMAVAVACGLAVGCKKDEPKPEPPSAEADKAVADEAAKATAKQRLEQIATGWLRFGGEMSMSFPTNAAPKAGVGLSWRVVILPYIGQDALYKKFKLDEPWDSEVNKALIDQMPDVYASPAKAAEKGHTYLRSFVGPHAALPDKPLEMAGAVPKGRMAMFRDGTSNTLTVAEAAEPVVWTKGEDLPYDGGAVPKLGGVFADGFHAVAADKKVYWVAQSTPAAAVGAALTIDGSEPLALESLADMTTPAKETARKRLKDVILAWHGHQDRYGALPTNMAPKAGVGLSWRVMILPMLKQDALYQQFKLDEPWDSETNKKLIDQMPDVYASAGKPAEKGMTYLRSFVGSRGAIPPKPLGPGPYPRGRMILFPDGTSNTLAVVEATEPVIWTKGEDLPFDGGPEKREAAVPKLGGPFDGGFHAAAADGSIVWFPKGVSATTLRAAITIDGAEVVKLPPAIPTNADLAPPPPVKPGPGKK